MTSLASISTPSHSRHGRRARQMLVTPGGLARLIVRSCQALSSADLALSSGDASAEVGGSAAVEGGGGGVAKGGGGASGILSGGAEGDMTAALRKLHELGPSLAGRCVSRVAREWIKTRLVAW